MGAGSSAETESRRQAALAKQHEIEAELARRKSGQFAAAAIAERRLAKRLAPLNAHGYFFLADRKWPGSKSAQLDLIVVGPSGVWIVDSKKWNDFALASGHMFRDQADVTEEILRLQDVAIDAEAVFSEIGLAPGEVRAILVMADHQGRLGEVGMVEVVGELDVHKTLASRGRRLSTAEVEKVFRVAMEYFPPYVGPQNEAPVSAATSVLPAPLEDNFEVELEDIALLSEEEVLQALTEESLTAPIEDWMTFLHPYQAGLVRKSFSGPSRIRGAAGTGKTVVGLHRAAYLARLNPNKRILFTTFVRTLPRVMSNLLKRMSPEVASRVDFISVHSFAAKVLRDCGINIRVDSRGASRLIQIAWTTISASSRDRLIERAKSQGAASGSDYWREEVESVIKGRGLISFDQYLECSRPGRSVRLNIDDRKAVWEFYLKYQQLLQKAGIADFQDQVLLAERALGKQPNSDYAAVIVDEAQDLTLAMIKMLYSLVGDAPDAFTLIGDGRQNIYPGGYLLSEAGISLAGRGVVLDLNYRNTEEILKFAESLIKDKTFGDIDDSAIATESPMSTDSDASQPPKGQILRRGPKPKLIRFSSKKQHDNALVERIRSAVSQGEYSLADFAVLCDTNGEVEKAIKLLNSSKIPTINLLDYDGNEIDKVKVGTVNRAKGLEFKFVLLPWNSEKNRLLEQERTDRELREKYVAATRARDVLWIGYC